MRIFSTFASGTTEPIVNFLREDIKPQVINSFDGLVEYQTDYPLEKIERLQYFKNTFRKEHFRLSCPGLYLLSETAS